MKRLLWVVLMPLIVFAPRAYANSILNINITYVTAVLNPGGSVGVTLIGPGTLITADAGMGCHDWCDGFPIPDLSSVAASQVFFSGNFGTVVVGGIDYHDIDINGFVFDLFGNLNPSVSAFVGSGETFKPINLILPGGGGWNFNFSGGPGSFVFVGGTFTAGTPPPLVTPEPATLGLMGTGLAALAGVIRRRRLTRRTRTVASVRV